MDESSLKAALNLKSVHLMNDLEAVARSVPVLRSTDLITLNQAVPVATGPIAIIAPGPGLGESKMGAWGNPMLANGSSRTHVRRRVGGLVRPASIVSDCTTRQSSVGAIAFILRWPRTIMRRAGRSSVAACRLLGFKNEY